MEQDMPPLEPMVKTEFTSEKVKTEPKLTCEKVKTEHKTEFTSEKGQTKHTMKPESEWEPGESNTTASGANDATSGVNATEPVTFVEDDSPYKCFITGGLMRNPVMASDGGVYEEYAIKEWMRISKDSPQIPGFKLTSVLIPDEDRKRQIQAYIMRHSIPAHVLGQIPLQPHRYVPQPEDLVVRKRKHTCNLCFRTFYIDLGLDHYACPFCSIVSDAPAMSQTCSQCHGIVEAVDTLDRCVLCQLTSPKVKPPRTRGRPSRAKSEFPESIDYSSSLHSSASSSSSTSSNEWEPPVCHFPSTSYSTSSVPRYSSSTNYSSSSWEPTSRYAPWEATAVSPDSTESHFSLDDPPSTKYKSRMDQKKDEEDEDSETSERRGPGRRKKKPKTPEPPKTSPGFVPYKHRPQRFEVKKTDPVHDMNTMD